jgi:hypothetical protein
MKFSNAILMIAFAMLSCFAHSAVADNQEAAPARTEQTTVPQGVVVPAWKDLSKSQQEKLQRFSQRWDQMPASRRVMILERLDRFDRMSPQQQKRLREAADNYLELQPRLQENLRRSMRYVRTLPPEEQKRLRQQWDNITPQHRRAWLEVGGPGLSELPPVPTAKDRKPQ